MHDLRAPDPALHCRLATMPSHGGKAKESTRKDRIDLRGEGIFGFFLRMKNKYVVYTGSRLADIFERYRD